MPPNAAELALTLTSCPLLQKTAAAACGSAAAARRWLNRTEHSRVECCNGSSSLADPASKSCEWGLLLRRETGRSTSRLAFVQLYSTKVVGLAHYLPPFDSDCVRD